MLCAPYLVTTGRTHNETLDVTHGDVRRTGARADIPRDDDAASEPTNLARDPASPRVRSFGTSVFTEMSRLANQYGAVNLGQGFPDFPGPSFAK